MPPPTRTIGATDGNALAAAFLLRGPGGMHVALAALPGIEGELRWTAADITAADAGPGIPGAESMREAGTPAGAMEPPPAAGRLRHVATVPAAAGRRDLAARNQHGRAGRRIRAPCDGAEQKPT
jgi:hypothetical protein